MRHAHSGKIPLIVHFRDGGRNQRHSAVSWLLIVYWIRPCSLPPSRKRAGGFCVGRYRRGAGSSLAVLRFALLEGHREMLGCIFVLFCGRN